MPVLANKGGVNRAIGPGICPSSVRDRRALSRPNSGKGRFLDNIFVERLSRTLKYECVYLHARETGSQARAGVRKWVDFYNQKRPHSALGGKPPVVVYWQRNEHKQPDRQVQRVA